MSFMKPVANVATFGAAGQLLGKKKKPGQEQPGIKPMITLSNRPVERTPSLIGSTRGMF